MPKDSKWTSYRFGPHNDDKIILHCDHYVSIKHKLAKLNRIDQEISLINIISETTVQNGHARRYPKAGLQFSLVI